MASSLPVCAAVIYAGTLGLTTQRQAWKMDPCSLLLILSLSNNPSTVTYPYDAFERAPPRAHRVRFAHRRRVHPQHHHPGWPAGGPPKRRAGIRPIPLSRADLRGYPGAQVHRGRPGDFD